MEAAAINDWQMAEKVVYNFRPVLVELVGCQMNNEDSVKLGALMGALACLP